MAKSARSAASAGQHAPRRQRRFRCIAADPPWKERGGGRIRRGANRHYKLISKKETIRDVMRASPVWRPAKSAHLYIWVTNNRLLDGLWLLDALGFRYVTNVVWHKTDRFGIGQYFRGKHELMLFGVRGDGYAVRTARRDLPSSIAAPHVYGPDGKIIHSRKPPVFRRLMEQRSRGPRAELFAREKVPGWQSWGDELVAA